MTSQSSQSNNPGSQRSLRAFLCHASDDKPRVHVLYRQLLTEGVDPWLDKENLLPGQNWQQEIRNTMHIMDVVIVCLSQNSINKVGFIQKEIAFALDRAEEYPSGTIFIIPVKLENCAIPERLKHLHVIDLYEERGFEFPMRSLKHRAETIGAVFKPTTINQPVSLQAPDSTNNSQQNIAKANLGIDVTFVNVNDGSEMDAELSNALTATQIIEALIKENFIPSQSNPKRPYLLATEGGQALKGEQTLADVAVNSRDHILVYGAIAQKSSEQATATDVGQIDITFVNVNDGSEMDVELSNALTATQIIEALIKENFIPPLIDPTKSYLSIY